MGVFRNSPITSPSQQLPLKENHTGALTVVKTIRKAVHLFRFSILINMFLIHVDAENFVSLTCTYYLTL